MSKSNKRDEATEKRRAELVREVILDPTRKQDALAEVLKGMGIPASQSTVSRDLQDLDIKWNKPEKRWDLPDAVQKALRLDKLMRMVEEYGESVCKTVGLFAIRTAPGHARSLAVLVEKAYPAEVFGTVAGEDSALVLVRKQEQAKAIADEITGMLEKRDAQ